MRLTRYVAGITCMLCIAWGFATYKDGEIPYEPIIAFISAFVVWSGSEFYTGKAVSEPALLHPHDRALGERFRAIMTEPSKRAFRDHSFGASFPQNRLDPLEILAAWEGPEFEFIDAELEKLRREIVRRCREILEVITQHGDAVGSGRNLISIVPRSERVSDWHSRETSILVGEVDGMADAIVSTADEFEKHFRVLSPQSYAETMQANS